MRLYIQSSVHQSFHHHLQQSHSQPRRAPIGTDAMSSQLNTIQGRDVSSSPSQSLYSNLYDPSREPITFPKRSRGRRVGGHSVALGLKGRAIRIDVEVDGSAALEMI